MTGKHERAAPEQAVRKRSALTIVIGLVALVLVGVVVELGSSTLGSLGVLSRPQRYIAIAIADPSRLPLRPVAGQPAKITFEVFDRMGHSIRQPWQISVRNGTRETVVARGVAAVTSGSDSRVSANVRVGRSASDILIAAPGTGTVPLQIHILATTG
jgi:hypothetical protein